MKIDGACHCGDITFEADVDPDAVSICHCTDCQHLTGTAFRVTVAVPRDRFRLTRGEPSSYVKTADNGARRLQQFCPRCGSPILTSGEGEAAEEIGIRWGNIAQRGALPPKRQIWCSSAADWLAEVPGLPGAGGRVKRAMKDMPRSRFRSRSGLVAGVVAMEAETDRTFARHSHDEFGIGLIDSGAQRSASGRGLVEAGPGQVITVNPGEVHDGRPIGSAGRRWRMLYIDRRVMNDNMRDIHEVGTPRFEFEDPVIADLQVAAAVSALIGAMTRDRHAAMEAEAGLIGLVARLSFRRPMSASLGKADVARERIDDDPASPVTLGLLAADAGLSRFQLLRAFTRETGLTPHAYVVQKRLGLARRLILRGLPLADAAATAGFADQSHMTRLFTRAFGITPGGLASGTDRAAISFKT